MAPEASAAKRAYEEIKRQILDGVLPARTRLDMEDLARALGLSSMPVRLALSMLTWERLVRPGQHAAYEVALWPAQDLADLYEWRGELLSLALPTKAAAHDLKRIARTQPYAQAVFGVMRLIGEGVNLELGRAALNADERLQSARMIEAEVMGDVQAEFETLVTAIADRAKRTSTLVKSYHRRRMQHATALRERIAMHALPKNGPR